MLVGRDGNATIACQEESAHPMMTRVGQAGRK